jgi:hypothetical protein
MTESATHAEDAAARVRLALLEGIYTHIARAPNASALLRLAEAYAWTVAPDQFHGARSAD